MLLKNDCFPDIAILTKHPLGSFTGDGAVLLYNHVSFEGTKCNREVILWVPYCLADGIAANISV